MTFLTFFPDGPPQVDVPSRVYARVDRLEPPIEGSEEGATVVLDSIEAEWFDSVGRERETLADPAIAEDVERHVSVLEVPFRRCEPVSALARAFAAVWLEVVLGGPGRGRPVLHYLNLFAPPLERSLLSLSRARRDVQRDLDSKTSLDAFPDAEEDEVAALLASVPEPEAAAVYDVGQGGCNALLAGGVPTLYFDLGGGVRGHARSFPRSLTTFCFDAAPPVVLSHWDDDHWSSAGRDPRAHAATWLAPRQKLLVTHNAFVGKIGAAGGTLLLWPANLRSHREGGLTVEHCTGSTKGRNDSGLALVVEGRDERADERMLFPADARYDFVPSAGLDFTHLVVAHHGGRTGSTFVPRSDRRTCGRLVYSYGLPNRHHPFASVEADHAAIWAHDLRTATRGSSGLGHIHLYWDDLDPDADPCCRAGAACGGGPCDLTCQQR
jgi:hypothetical protein